MTDLNHQTIKQLKEEVKKLTSSLIQISQNVENLKTQNRSELIAKEKELEDWRKKLEVLQQERNRVKQEIKEKRLELEKSELSNAEKQEKINQLLTGHSEEWEEVDKLFYDERSQYRQIRDKVFEMMCQPCQTCEAKEQNIRNLEERVSNLKIWSVLLLLSGIFNFFLFLYVVFNKKKKNNVLCPCLDKN